jgi:hypothetical protein
MQSSQLDSFSPAPTEPSYSSQQSAVTSELHNDNDLLSTPASSQSIPCPLPPSILNRANAQRHVVWEPATAAQFQDWWNDTRYGIQNATKKERKLRWDKPKVSKHWLSFKQAALIRNGEPNIICRLCHKVLIHPSLSNTGTTNMKNHLKSTSCLKGRDGGVQSDLVDILCRVWPDS